jgi:L-ascorbate metabolism protein UlaG (beta-lactamase superfamily)
MPDIIPIEHASFIMKWGGEVIYHDPVGSPERYTIHGLQTIIMLTHSHPDHFDVSLLTRLATSEVVLVAPQEVYNLLPEPLRSQTTVMHNGDITTLRALKIEAIPMYNTTPDRQKYHVKGVGNGYVIERNGIRVYNASDTEDTDELRAVSDVAIAFVPMNEPYTMSVEQAVDAVLAFAPQVVYPYHYRSPDGHSDVASFKTLVKSKNPEIEVVLAEWYPS